MPGPEEWPPPFRGYRNRLTVRKALLINARRCRPIWRHVPRVCATLELVPKIWSRFHSSLEVGMRQQVTRLGLLFTMSCVIVALAAFASANNLLFLILGVML